MSTLRDWLEIFKIELKTQYSTAEIKTLFSIFASEYLGLSATEIALNLNQKVLSPTNNRLEESLEQLKTGKPYQQILGKAWFFGAEFLVNEHTLIPRPETEELIELALSKLNRAKLSVLDIGTGSGCIAITLAKRLKNPKICAIDISNEAIKIAEENANRQEVKIKFLQTNFLQEKLSESFDVIISNPPYIGKNEENEISKTVKDFEPTIALFPIDQDPLIFYRKIALEIPEKLNPNGFLFLEINQKIGNETLALFENCLKKVHLEKDLSGNDRMIWGQKE